MNGDSRLEGHRIGLGRQRFKSRALLQTSILSVTQLAMVAAHIKLNLQAGLILLKTSAVGLINFSRCIRTWRLCQALEAITTTANSVTPASMQPQHGRLKPGMAQRNDLIFI